MTHTWRIDAAAAVLREASHVHLIDDELLHGRVERLVACACVCTSACVLCKSSPSRARVPVWSRVL